MTATHRSAGMCPRDASQAPQFATQPVGVAGVGEPGRGRDDPQSGGQVAGVPVTNRLLPRSQFARAFERAPLGGPGQLQDLQGPSYLFAILTDPRIVTADAVPRDEGLEQIRGVGADEPGRPALDALCLPGSPGTPGSSAADRPPDPGQAVFRRSCVMWIHATRWWWWPARPVRRGVAGCSVTASALGLWPEALLAGQPGPAKPASIFRPRRPQGIRDQRRVGRAAKGWIRRDRRRQSGKRPVPPSAQARNVELPAAGAAGPHLCLGGRDGRRGHARESAPEPEAGAGARCVMSPLRPE